MYHQAAYNRPFGAFIRAAGGTTLPTPEQAAACGRIEA